MENASYALILAVSVLVACMLIAVVLYVFNNLSAYQQSNEDIVYRDSITEFNKAFESYNKSLMYGTDVLSCLNLAENNNQKYVYELYEGDDPSSVSYADREDLLINVHVTLNDALTETIKVYYQTSTGTYQPATTSDEYSFKLFKENNGFTLPTVTYYYFTGTRTNNSSVQLQLNSDTENYASIMWDGVSGSLSKNDTKLKAGTYSTTISAGEYSLVAESEYSSDGTAKLIALLSTVTETEQTIYNEDYSGTGNGDWAYATWATAVYDFKTRKFKCTDMTVNTEGYVDEIWFEEVEN